MKLHCHRSSLIDALSVVSVVVPSRTPKEILKNVKLDVADGAATLIGTDQEVGIRFEVQGVETDSSGVALLPTGRLVSILRELHEATVDLELTEEAIWIRSGGSEFRLSAEDPAEFPDVAAFNEEAYSIVSASVLRELIRRTIFATDTESTRYALGGVLVELEPDHITLAATDSRRLAVADAPCGSQGDIANEAGKNPVIPSKAMSLLEKTLGDDSEDVFIAVHDNDVVVKSGSSTIYSRLVEGRFPNYKQVIPESSSTAVDLVVGPFHSAVRQAQIVTSDESRGVDFQFVDGTMTLTSVAADVGQSTIQLPIAYSADELTITFDPKYVADFLKILGPETNVRLELIDSESAAVLKLDDAYTYVIMPLSRDH